MIIHGKDLFLCYMDAEGTWRVFGAERTCSLSATTDMQEVAGLDSARWKEYIPMLSSWRMQFGGNLMEATDIDDLYLNRTPIGIRMKVGNIYYEGLAYIASLNISGTVHELGQVSFELIGSGPLTKHIEPARSCFGTGRWLSDRDWLIQEIWKDS